MSKRIEQIDNIQSSNPAAPIQVAGIAMEYTDAQDSSTFDNNTIPDWNSVLEAINEFAPPPAARVAIPITNPSSSFSYDSGVTGLVPPNMGIYIVRGASYQKITDPFWDGTTGLITTDVDTSADSYVLVLG